MLALQLYDLGILVVPCTHTRPIQPLVEYSHWREKKPERSEYQQIWEKHSTAGHLMLCESIESIDLDTKNQLFGQDIIGDFEREIKNLNPDLFKKILIEQSPSGGMHYIYRTETPGASCTLARRPSDDDELRENPKLKYRTLVDYLAHGKLCRIHPSQGYKLIQGNFLEVPFISDDERRQLLSAALSLNSYYDQPEHHYHNGNGTTRPGDEYNDKTTPDDILNLLQRNGWRFLRRRGPYIDLNRPGARNQTGVDGTIHTDQKWFYPWSSSCGFPQQKAYDFFGTYAILEHSGDIGRAARSLVALRPQPAPQRPVNGHTQPEQQVTWTQKLEANKFSFGNNYEAEWMLYHTNPYAAHSERTPIAALGQIVCVIGPAKSFKSQVVGAIVSSALGRKHEIGFEIEMPFLKPKIILLDTEQDKSYFGGSVKRIHWQANINHDLPHFTAYSMVDSTVDERLTAISSLIDENPDVGLFIIDGLLDMVKNYNDEQEASRLSEFLLRQKSKGVMILIVCHTGEMKGNQMKPIGAVGSMILRKGEVFITLEIVNPKEEDEKMRRVKIRPKHGRGRSFKSTEVMSYEKMLYLAGYGIPQHYRDHAHPATKETEDTVPNTPAPVPVMPSPREEPKEDDPFVSATKLLAQNGWVPYKDEDEEDEALFQQFLKDVEQQ